MKKVISLLLTLILVSSLFISNSVLAGSLFKPNSESGASQCSSFLADNMSHKGSALLPMVVQDRSNNLLTVIMGRIRDYAVTVGDVCSVLSSSEFYECLSANDIENKINRAFADHANDLALNLIKKHFDFLSRAAPRKIERNYYWIKMMDDPEYLKKMAQIHINFFLRGDRKDYIQEKLAPHLLEIATYLKKVLRPAEQSSDYMSFQRPMKEILAAGSNISSGLTPEVHSLLIALTAHPGDIIRLTHSFDANFIAKTLTENIKFGGFFDTYNYEHDQHILHAVDWRYASEDYPEDSWKWMISILKESSLEVQVKFLEAYEEELVNQGLPNTLDLRSLIQD